MLGFQSGDSQGGRAGLQPDGGLARDRQAAVAGRPRRRARARALDACGRGAGGRSRRPAAPIPTSRPRPAPICGPATTTLCDALALAVPGFDPDLTAGIVRRSRRRRSAGTTGGSFAHGRADRADQRRRLARGRAHGAARAQPRAGAGDDRPDGAAARRAQRDRRCSSTVSAAPTASSCRARARRPRSRATPFATSCSRPRSRAACASLRSPRADVKAYIKAHAGTRTRTRRDRCGR